MSQREREGVGRRAVSRRSFVRAAAGLGGLAVAAEVAGAAGRLFALGATPADAAEKAAASGAADAGGSRAADAAGAGVATDDKVVWGHCSPNCYGRCALRLHVHDDQVTWVESDTTGDDTFGDHQIRACLRGRSLRRLLNDPDRLTRPLKRVGPRGSGEFQEVSWDEAIQFIYDNYTRVLDEYGPSAVFCTNATGVKAQNISDFLPRLLNLNGGFLINSGGYSAHQIKTALPYLYGKRSGNSSADIKNSRLVVMFGDNFSENKLGGAGDGYVIEHALEEGGAEVVIIDPRFTPTAAVHADQWIPIRPGTDAALVDAMAYVLITEDLVDHDFLDSHCIGYDEDTLPEGAPAGGSYKSYITGAGPDGVQKTPEWASPITGIPAQTIVDLARRVAAAKPCCIMQGLGGQRQQNGEQTTRAICMLAILTGNVGVAGGGTGSSFGSYDLAGIEVPTGDNPVKASVPTYMWVDAVARGGELTKKNAGIKGVDRLEQPIKMIFNYGGNSLTNQQGNVRRSHEVLADESLCECIVVWETKMTDSARYADVILPDLMPVEQPNFVAGEYDGSMGYLIMGQPCTGPTFERKTLYQSLCLLADKLGCLDAFTEGLDEQGWLERLYREAQADNDAWPTYEDMLARGVWRQQNPKGDAVAFKAFREDPEANPLDTDSGKIEIYSQKLADLAASWDLGEGDVISPLPVFVPAVNGWDGTPNEQYPLQLVGYHARGHAHSSFTQVDVLTQANHDAFWINPADAEARGIADGDLVHAFNETGDIRVTARVTNRVMPGVTAYAEGLWVRMAEDGVDEGASVNSLIPSHPSPLAKAMPANGNMIQVERAM